MSKAVTPAGFLKSINPRSILLKSYINKKVDDNFIDCDLKGEYTTYKTLWSIKSDD